MLMYRECGLLYSLLLYNIIFIISKRFTYIYKNLESDPTVSTEKVNGIIITLNVIQPSETIYNPPVGQYLYLKFATKSDFSQLK